MATPLGRRTRRRRGGATYTRGRPALECMLGWAGSALGCRRRILLLPARSLTRPSRLGSRVSSISPSRCTRDTSTDAVCWRLLHPNPKARGARGRRHEPRAARPCPPPPAAPRVRARRALPCAQPIRFFLAADSDTCVVFAAWLRSSRSGAGARGLLASRIHPLRRLNCSAAEAAPGPTEEAPASPARKYAPRLPARVVFDVML